MRSGASVTLIRQAAVRARVENDIQVAWGSLFEGRLDRALEVAYACAVERAYDVDSRIVHGIVRLARHELDHAAHEFDAVIEEFGAESDAADGRRAVILARGFAPLDDIPAADVEWRAAATLLTTLWRLADVVESRLDTLQSGQPAGLALLQEAIEAARAAELEVHDGTV